MKSIAPKPLCPRADCWQIPQIGCPRTLLAFRAFPSSVKTLTGLGKPSFPWRVQCEPPSPSCQGNLQTLLRRPIHLIWRFLMWFLLIQMIITSNPLSSLSSGIILLCRSNLIPSRRRQRAPRSTSITVPPMVLTPLHCV